MLVLSFLLLIFLLLLLWSLFICLLVKVSIRSLLKGRHAQYCWHSDWLTDWGPSNTLDVCVKKRKWEEGRQSGCQEGAAPRANAAARPFTQCFFMRSCWFSFPFLWLIYLKGIQTNRTLFFFFFFVIVVFLYLIIRQEERRKKDNHPAVCMTRKHQLKTIHCIPYYFMLGWNLSACI